MDQVWSCGPPLATRRPLLAFDSDLVTKSFGISPGGERFAVAGGEQLLSVMLAEGLSDVAPARR